MICPTCQTEMVVQHVCTQCGATAPIMTIALLDEQKMGEIVDAFITSGDTAEFNALFDAYEPLITEAKDSGLRLAEWNKFKADIRGLAVAILNHDTGTSK